MRYCLLFAFGFAVFCTLMFVFDMTSFTGDSKLGVVMLAPILIVGGLFDLRLTDLQFLGFVLVIQFFAGILLYWVMNRVYVWVRSLISRVPTKASLTSKVSGMTGRGRW
jgi:hypothetical protein